MPSSIWWGGLNISTACQTSLKYFLTSPGDSEHDRSKRWPGAPWSWRRVETGGGAINRATVCYYYLFISTPFESTSRMEINELWVLCKSLWRLLRNKHGFRTASLKSIFPRFQGTRRSFEIHSLLIYNLDAKSNWILNWSYSFTFVEKLFAVRHWGLGSPTLPKIVCVRSSPFGLRQAFL